MKNSSPDGQGIALAAVRFAEVMQISIESGLSGSAAAAHANQIVTRDCGIDLLDYLKLANALEHIAEPAYSPTELGKRIGLSVVAFNRALEEMGFQTKADGKRWEHTAEGSRYGVYQAASRGGSSGEPDLRLRWKESVLAQVQTHVSSKPKAV